MNSDSTKRASALFWQMAGDKEPFPRSLESAASWGLPVAIVKLPRLWMADIRDELKRYGINWTAPHAAMCLRGFMMASRGKGFIFIDASDAADEQRYSLAHEIAHFLLDYYLPRMNAIEKLGPAIQAVLDGERTPTWDERVHSVLSGAPIGTYQHSAYRTAFYAPEKEDFADALALELLAPTEEVWTHAKGLIHSMPVSEGRVQLAELLKNEFGLPYFSAVGTADVLAARWWPRSPFRTWIGIKS